ncbi:MAG: YkoF family thiamine/hydroxymethylpyrimidine-binding protein [Reyranella sp.]
MEAPRPAAIVTARRMAEPMSPPEWRAATAACGDRDDGTDGAKWRFAAPRSASIPCARRISGRRSTARATLEAHGLHPEVGPMSTVVTGDAGIVFAALADAFDKAAQAGQVVMALTVSNACPVGRATSDRADG